MTDYIAIDLGTTNVKTAVYDDTFELKGIKGLTVEYDRANGYCEFDIEVYCGLVFRTIAEFIDEGVIGKGSVSRIILTGQAESLIVLDEDMKPLMNAISWMDERSLDECEFLKSVFSFEEYYGKTGQTSIIPTWPATKILWLKNNHPEIYAEIKYYVLLKDYVAYRLTGVLSADRSIATFSFYFDIWDKCYWPEMCEALGVSTTQLPPLIEPCTDIGPLTPGAAALCGLSETTIVNNGTLDHFTGMIGVGNIEPGTISLSTGTVMALATMTMASDVKAGTMALHYGFLPDTYVYIMVSESGGSSLEWYRDQFLPEMSFEQINDRLKTKDISDDVLFLPYVVGVNSPEYDNKASGLFFGLRAKHDRLDLAYSVMEGVAILLAKNVDALLGEGLPVKKVIATGGGAKSNLWCGLQADATGIPIQIPRDKEASCLGAVIIGTVADKTFTDYKAAVDKAVGFEKTFQSNPNEKLKLKRKQFDLLYDAMIEAARL